MGSSSRDPFDDSVDQNFNRIVDQFLDQNFWQFVKWLWWSTRAKEIKEKTSLYWMKSWRSHTRLWNNYFIEAPPHPVALLRRRFRMNKPLFFKIVARLSNEVEFFWQKEDAPGKPGLAEIQKCAAAIRLVAYDYAGDVCDVVDEYLQIGETTARQYLENFIKGLVHKKTHSWGSSTTTWYWRTTRISRDDRKHWLYALEWKNCPRLGKGNFHVDITSLQSF